MARVNPSELRQQGGFTTSDARVEVDVSSDRLSIGTHNVTLQVRDQAGNTGTATLQIQVVDRGNPNAVARLLNQNGVRITSVPVGVGFILSGEESFDPEGSPITEFNWVLQSPLRIDPIDPIDPTDPIGPIGPLG